MMINCYKLIPWSHFFFLSYLWEIERVNWMRTDLILWEMFSAVEYIYQQSGRFPHHLWVESLNNYQNRKAMCQLKSKFLFFLFFFGTMLQHTREEGLVDGFSVLKFWFFHPSSSQCLISEDGIVKGQNTNICTLKNYHLPSNTCTSYKPSKSGSSRLSLASSLYAWALFAAWLR